MKKLVTVFLLAVMMIMAVPGVGSILPETKVSAAVTVNKTTAFSVTGKTETTVSLKWAKVSGVDGYKIVRSTSKTSGYKEVGTVRNPATVTFKDTGLKPGTKYYYKTRSYKYVGGRPYFSAYTAPREVTTKAIPKTTSFTATPKSDVSVTLKWAKVSGVTGYKIERSTSKTSGYAVVGTVKSASTVIFSDKKAAPGKKYYYRTRSYKTINGKNYYSAYTISREVTTKNVAKTGSFSVTGKTETTVSLKWAKATGVDGYKIEKSTSKTSGYKEAGTVRNPATLTFKVTGLKVGTKYYFRTRSYKYINGKAYFSAYTAPREVTTTAHNYKATVLQAATCKDKGVKEFCCTVCGDKYLVESPALTTHTYNSGKVTKAATCKEAGVKTFTCTVCSATKTETIAKLTTHSYDSGKTTKAATCTAAGVKTYTCTVCAVTKTEEIPKLGHVFGSWKTIKAASCEEGGQEYHQCSRCDEKQPRYTDALGHNYGTDHKCTRCGKSDGTATEDPTDPGSTEDPVPGSKYHYNIELLTPSSYPLYSGVVYPVYIETDNPNPKTIKMDTNARAIVGPEITYLDVEYDTESSFYNDNYQWMPTKTHSGYIGNVEFELLGTNTYKFYEKLESTGERIEIGSLTVTIQDHDTAYNAWLDSKIASVTTNAMTQKEKLDACWNEFRSIRYGVPREIYTNNGKTFVYLTTEPQDIMHLEQFDCGGATNIMIYCAKKFGYSDDEMYVQTEAGGHMHLIVLNGDESDPTTDYNIMQNPHPDQTEINNRISNGLRPWSDIRIK